MSWPKTMLRKAIVRPFHRAALLDFLHLYVLAGFAVAQPLLDLLRQYPEFFIARKAEPWEVLALTAIVVLLPALPLVLLEILAGWVGPRAQRRVHTVLVALLAAAIVLPVANRAEGLLVPLLMAVSLLAGGAFGFGYLRFPLARRFVTLLLPVLVIAPAIFLLNGEIRELLAPERTPEGRLVATVERPAPVVFLVFDELAVIGLMKRDGSLDKEAFPHFAALAADGLWFRNASTVADGTVQSIPSLVSGRYPVVRSGEPNVFTALAGTYDFRAFSSFLPMCPKTVCQRGRPLPPLVRLVRTTADSTAIYLNILLPRRVFSGLPDITQHWGNFAGVAWLPGNQPEPGQDKRITRFEQFLETLQATERPTFYYLHSHFPHMPYRYLPSGQAYSGLWFAGLNGASGRWKQDPWAVDASFQRFLLQLAHTDRLLGGILERLRQVGLYDRAMIIVTSDHGVSHRPGDLRRIPTASNHQDIMRVPLFIKLPHREAVGVSDINAETVDIVPTVAEVLGFDLGYQPDGQSLLQTERKARQGKGVYDSRNGWMRFSAEFPYGEVLAQKDRLFDREGGPDRFFRMGPFRGLVGKPVERLPGAAASGFSARFESPAALLNVSPTGERVPSHIIGTIRPEPADGKPLDLAIVVNGVVAAVTRTFLPRDGGLPFSFFVPPQAFREGRNEAEIRIILRQADGTVALAPAPEESPVQYRLAARDGKETISGEDGSTYRVVPGKLVGWVDSTAEGEGWVRYVGWAFDKEANQEPEQLLLFADGAFVAAAGTGQPRPDVANVHGSRAGKAGFVLTVTRPGFGRSIFSRHRVFAVSKRGVASELAYYRGFKWGF